MKTKNEQKVSDKLLALSDIALKKIPSRQKSVRTTIRIPQKGHDAINRISEHKQTKNAEVFNSILEAAIMFSDRKVNFDIFEFTKKDTVRKTYVMKENTLLQLSQVAKQLNISRDALITKTAELIDFALDKQLQERDKKYSKYLGRIDKVLDELQNIFKEMSENLDVNDPVFSNMAMIIDCAINQIDEMNEYVYEKTPIKKEG